MLNEESKLTAKGAWRTAKEWFRHHITIFILCAIVLVLGWFAYTQFTANTKAQIEKNQTEEALSATQSQLEKAQSTLAKTETTLRKTEEDLSYANDQVTLLEDTTAALKRQITGLNKTIEQQEKRIKELLNIQSSKPKITTVQLEEQISAIAELVTLKYIYSNSSRKEGNLTWLWGWTLPFSDSSLLVTYDGTIKAGIDFKEIKFAMTGKTITVTMPKSRVLDHNIPQETINVLEVKNGLFNPVTFDDYNQFIAEEKKVMEEKAITKGLLKDADKEAKSVVETFLRSIPGMGDYTLKFK